MDLPKNPSTLNRAAVFSALLFAAALPSAHAQATARYCDGTLALNSIFSRLQSEGSRSTVSYFAQLQNLSNGSQRFSIRFTAPDVLQAQNGSSVGTLASYQTQTITLGKRQFNNPAGTGAPAAQDMLRFVQVNCPR